MTQAIQFMRVKKQITLTSYHLSKLHEFFNPRIHQVQVYFFKYSDMEIVDFLLAMGYTPNENTRLNGDGDDMYYFDIPEQFRHTTIKTDKHISW